MEEIEKKVVEEVVRLMREELNALGGLTPFDNSKESIVEEITSRVSKKYGVNPCVPLMAFGYAYEYMMKRSSTGRGRFFSIEDDFEKKMLEYTLEFMNRDRTSTRHLLG